jgi:hypothetical protein
MTSILGLVLTLLIAALLLWGGDRLLALWPGNPPLKQVIRIVVIIAVALWCLSLIAGYFGIPMPWGPAPYRHR